MNRTLLSELNNYINKIDFCMKAVKRHDADLLTLGLLVNQGQKAGPQDFEVALADDETTLHETAPYETTNLETDLEEWRQLERPEVAGPAPQEHFEVPSPEESLENRLTNLENAIDDIKMLLSEKE